MDELKRLIAVARQAIEIERAETPAFDREDYYGWRRHHEAAVNKLKATLEAEGATFAYKAAHDHWVKLAGIRSSSTSGFVGALHNWVRAASQRIEGAAR